MLYDFLAFISKKIIHLFEDTNMHTFHSPWVAFSYLKSNNQLIFDARFDAQLT